MIAKTLGKIDWTKDAASIERLIRGMSPWPSAYTSLGTKTVKLWKAQVLPQGPEAKAEPGTVVSVSKDSFSVPTGDVASADPGASAGGQEAHGDSSIFERLPA